MSPGRYNTYKYISHMYTDIWIRMDIFPVHLSRPQEIIFAQAQTLRQACQTTRCQ